jgi:creatinine amidohydrolase
MREIQLELMRPDQIAAEKARCAIAYLAVGPLEWHGPAAPFGTDPLTAYEVAKRCARQVGGVVLPPLYIGTERERKPQDLANMGFADTDQYILGMDFPANSAPSYYFREDIFALVLREYLRLLHKQGYKLAVVVNGHGASGQVESANRVAAEFNGETDMRVLVAFPAASLGFAGEDPGHATRAEISTMMALTDSVDLGKLPQKGEPIVMWQYGMADGSAFAGHPNADFSVTDDPREGSAELGERYLAAGTQNVISLVQAAWDALRTEA